MFIIILNKVKLNVIQCNELVSPDLCCRDNVILLCTVQRSECKTWLTEIVG